MVLNRVDHPRRSSPELSPEVVVGADLAVEVGHVKVVVEVCRWIYLCEVVVRVGQ